MSNIVKNIEKSRHSVVCRGFSNLQNCRFLRNYESFFILNSNLNPTPEDYRAAFLIDADVIDQTTPQFFPELRLFSGQAVAVCGSTENRHGIVLAKSELAKRAGVKTGMVNWEARQ